LSWSRNIDINGFIPCKWYNPDRKKKKKWKIKRENKWIINDEKKEKKPSDQPRKVQVGGFEEHDTHFCV